MFLSGLFKELISMRRDNLVQLIDIRGTFGPCVKTIVSFIKEVMCRIRVTDFLEIDT